LGLDLSLSLDIEMVKKVLLLFMDFIMKSPTESSKKCFTDKLKELDAYTKGGYKYPTKYGEDPEYGNLKEKVGGFGGFFEGLLEILKTTAGGGRKKQTRRNKRSGRKHSRQSKRGSS
jgi:hypothetical protein